MNNTPIVSRISDYRDRVTGQTLPADGNASGASFSGNGLLVAFTSTAGNIASHLGWGGTIETDGDGGYADVYFHMLNGGDNTLLSGEYNGIFDVRLTGGLMYPATSQSAVFSPVSDPPPLAIANSSLQWLAFVTDSGGGHLVDTASGPVLVIPESDGSKDIAIANIFYNQNGPVDQASSHTFGFNFGLAASGAYVVEESADVTGTPAFSGDGVWLGYAAGDPMQADFDGHQLRLLPVHRPMDGSSLLLRADAAIGTVALSQDGRLVAFDTAASEFDLDGDGAFEIHFVEPDSHRNVFVLDRATGTVTRLTNDSAQAPALEQGAHVAGFLPDASGGAPTLLVDSVAHPTSGAPLARSQTILYQLNAGHWVGEIVSTTDLGTPAGTTAVGTLAADLAQPTGKPWAAMLSSEANLPGAQPGAATQGWVGGLGLAPQLVTPGDPVSGLFGANAAITSLALSPVGVPAGSVSFLSGQQVGAPVPLLAYATHATNLLGAPPTGSSFSSVYVATFDAPGLPPPPPPAVLDYTPGGPLNPLQQGSASVQGIALDATLDRITELGAGNASTATTISDRIGRPYHPDEPLRVISPPPGTLLLAGGDDVVVGLPLEGSIDGGGGVDTLLIPANTPASAYTGATSVLNFERLEFDPAAQPQDQTAVWLNAPAGVLPVSTVVGSDGVDVLRVSIFAPNAVQTVLDLRSVAFNQWSGQSGGDQLQVDAPTSGTVEVHAHPGTPMAFWSTAQATVYGSDGVDSLLGSELADHFEAGAGDDFLVGGPGADHLDGGPGRDLASWAGVWAVMPRPAPVFVDLADGLPERGGTAEGDVLVGIEDLWGSPDGDELRGDAQNNQIDGYDGNDLIEGRAGDDTLLGALGDDTLAGGAGNDSLRGGPGNDTAAWAGHRADFAVVDTGTGSLRLIDQRTGSPEGTDTADEIELFRFEDGSFTRAQLLAPPTALVSLASASVASVAEGSAGGLAGLLSFVIVRAGDLSGSTTVNLRIEGGDAPAVDGSDIAQVRTAAGLLGTALGDYAINFAPGQAQVVVEVQARADGTFEPAENLRLQLLSANGGQLDPAGVQSAQGLFLNDDPPPLLPPALSVGIPAMVEGDTQVLTITPAAYAGDAQALQYRIDWGDGSAPQLVSGAQLAAASGVFQHLYADDPGGPVNPSTLGLTVSVSDPVTAQSAQATRPVLIEDHAPSVGYSWANGLVEHDTPFTLTVNHYADVAGDPLQQLQVVWDGDAANAQTLVLGGSASRSFGGLQSHTARLDVVNDDGTFTAVTIPFATAASMGGAAPNGTPAQWAAAWTDSLMAISHKADASNAAEPWSAATLTALNAGVLAGGDLYGGLLGVSGRSANTSTVRQEIDGTEALRIELAPGVHANSLVLDLARLFTNDAAGGLREAGTVLLYDGNTLVGGTSLLALNANGKLHVELFNQPAFNSLVFQAGAVDENAGGVFRPGGMVDDQGGYVQAPAGAGSEYLIEALQLLSLPGVPPMGQATGFGG